MSPTHPVHAQEDADADALHAAAAHYETANKHHFDSIAPQYDDRPDARKFAEIVGRAMVRTGLFQPGVTTVMDFACGSGLVSRVLAAEDPKSIVGVDISQGMVDQYNKVVSDHGIPPEEMRAVCVALTDLKNDSGQEELRGMTFDVIVCVAAYHHFTSIDDVTQTLVATYLNPGGSLLVADVSRGSSPREIFPENVSHIVAHRSGFTEQDMRSTFEKAGLKNITFRIIEQVMHAGNPADVFLARGDK